MTAELVAEPGPKNGKHEMLTPSQLQSDCIRFEALDDTVLANPLFCVIHIGTDASPHKLRSQIPALISHKALFDPSTRIRMILRHHSLSVGRPYGLRSNLILAGSRHRA